MDHSTAIEYPDYEQPFWSAAREGRLRIQQCEACGQHQHYPRLLCVNCQSRQLRWIDSSGQGTIYSFTIVHRAPTDWQHLAPYALVVVELAEGPRITSRLVASNLPVVRIGSRVTATFAEVVPGLKMPLFQLA